MRKTGNVLSGLASLWVMAGTAAVLVAAGCGQSSTTGPPRIVPTTPGALASPTGTPAMFVPTFTAISPPPSGTPYTDLGYLEGQLPENAPIPANQSGAIGMVVAVGSTSITLQQVPITDATEAQLGAVDMHVSVPVGTLAAPLTILAQSTTKYVGATNLAAVHVGDVVAAGGTAQNGTLLAAAIVDIPPNLSFSPAASATSSPRVAQAAQRVTATRNQGVVRVTQSVATTASVNDAVMWTDGGAGGGYAVPPLELDLPPCAKISLGGNGVVGAIQKLNMPFTIAWNQNPPNYAPNGSGGFSPPTAMPLWMTFSPSPGSSASPTASVAVGLGAGESLTLTLGGCLGAPTVFTLGRLSLGYQLLSQSTSPMPGLGQSITLDPKSCLSLIGAPVNLQLKLKVPQFDARLCDPAEITGNLLYASISNVTGGQIQSPSVEFDAAKAPVAPDAGYFKPNAAQMSFTFNKFEYAGSWTDKMALQFILAGTTEPLVPLPPFDVSSPIYPITINPIQISISIPASASIIVTPPTASLSVGQSVQLTPSLHGYSGLFTAYAGCPPGTGYTLTPMTGIATGSAATFTYVSKPAFFVPPATCNVYFNTSVNGGGGPGGTGVAAITIN